MFNAIHIGLASLISIWASPSPPPLLPQIQLVEVVEAAEIATTTPASIPQMIEQYGLTQPLTSTDIQQMKNIAYCESTYTQFNKDGSLFRGKITPKDVGVYQINERWNPQSFPNAYTTSGNIVEGFEIYKKLGTKPWLASKPCWGKLKSEVVN